MKLNRQIKGALISLWYPWMNVNALRYISWALQEKNWLIHSSLSHSSRIWNLRSERRGTRPHSSLITMGNDTEKLIPRASWKPNHQPMVSAGPKLQKYGDAAPKPVWRRTTRPKKPHKGRHSWLFRGCFLWFRSNCQRKAQRERDLWSTEQVSRPSVSLFLRMKSHFVGWLENDAAT